ncbi:MAG: hypothetical protein WKF94_06930 [Solirubrobacteraceae bacterium]
MKELSTQVVGSYGFHLVGAFYLLHDNRNDMLPVEADLTIEPGGTSTVKVGSSDSVFEMPTGERRFASAMENVEWTYSVNLQLT